MPVSDFRTYFDRIEVINLPDRTDRYHQVRRELERVGLPLGVGNVRLFGASRPSANGGFPTLGYYGCFLSHLNVLRQAQRDNLESILILEDDVAFRPEFRRDQKAIVEQLSESPWEIAYLGHGEPLPAHGGTTVMIPFGERIMLGHCYAVHCRAFEPMIDFMETLMARPPGHPLGGPMSHDGAMWTFRQQQPDIVTLIASPSLAFQRPSRSDNNPKWFDSFPLLRKVCHLARFARIWIGRK